MRSFRGILGKVETVKFQQFYLIPSASAILHHTEQIYVLFCTRLTTVICSQSLLTFRASLRPKPLFWFRSDTETETQIGRHFQPIP